MISRGILTRSLRGILPNYQFAPNGLRRSSTACVATLRRLTVAPMVIRCPPPLRPLDPFIDSRDRTEWIFAIDRSRIGLLSSGVSMGRGFCGRGFVGVTIVGVAIARVAR